MPGRYPPRQRSAISWRNWSTSAGNVVPSSQSRRFRVLGCSSLGSFAVVHDPAQMESLTPSGLEEAGLSGALYQASKSAVNMLTVQYARQLPNRACPESRGFSVATPW
jgi:NAD(P)-dependent dehydrogenase (short-subunit alcohol dehydrogenase family)